MDQVDLLKAFRSFDGFREMMIENLLPALNDPNSAAVAFFALEGLFRIETEVESGQFVEDVFEDIRKFLRKWRCESPLDESYSGGFNRVAKFLRSLTVFKILKVPLFIDDYGTRRLMSDYSELKYIRIDLDTTVVHITHAEQKDSIVAEQNLKPSDNKNIIEGTWFLPKGQRGSGMFGSWAFETTLRKLGVSGIHQGEIVSYKREVNFIVYASDTLPPDTAKKATDDAVMSSQNDSEAYSVVSIFVPSRFLPQQGFMKGVIADPYRIPHRPFCVKEKRSRDVSSCKELIRS